MIPEVVAFRGRISVQSDDALPIEAAIVTVLTKGGQSFAAHVKHARGSLERPLSDVEIERKARQLAVLGGTNVDVSDDAGQIMKLAVPKV